MELKVNAVSIPEAITFNYKELKAELIQKASSYESMVYTPEQIQEAKADRAKLNGLKKAMNEERLKREREHMEYPESCVHVKQHNLHQDPIHGDWLL